MQVPDAPPPPRLAPTLGELGPRPRDALDRLSAVGFRSVQLSASQAGLRPRDLDRSGRRDLLGRLRRLEMTAAGVDLWIPESHLTDPAQIDRAVAAILDAVGLAADLGRCPLSLMFPSDDEAMPPTVVEAIAERALRHGVAVADHRVPPAEREDIGVGIDPATWLGRGQDPVEAVATHAQRLATARLSDLAGSGERLPVRGEPEGRLDVFRYRHALDTSGYQGHVVVDLRGWSDPWGDLPAAAQAWAAAGHGGGFAI